MTLRGELDAFPLETVVQLIHSTNKTGQLEVRGDDAGGTLGFDGGRLVSAIAGEDSGEAALGAVFAVTAGGFEFIPWNDPPAANLAGDLDQLLDTAAEERDRIFAIRKVIPDDRATFRLSGRAAERDSITLQPDQWRALLAVNGERDVRGVAEQLKSGALATRATLAGLLEAGFIDLHAPAPLRSEQWSRPARQSAAPAPVAPTWVAPVLEPMPEPVSSWEPAAPAPEPAADWERPAPTPRSWEQPQPDLRADLAAALDARMSAAPPAPPAPPALRVEPETLPAPSPIDIPPASDDRLAALSGLLAPVQPVQPVEPVAPPVEPAPAVAPPPPIEPTPAVAPPPPADRINEWSRMAAEVQAPEAPPEERKKGLFGFLKRDESEHESAMAGSAATGLESPATGVGRAGQLASMANALLAEYNSGQYGKGRLDDRMANLLMRVDEQADPIDRPLPIVDDRIDAQALDRENMPEQQAVPYLAMLVGQIYEDAERTFGRDKAKRGYKAAQQQVFGADASALSAPDVAGRLPKV